MAIAPSAFANKPTTFTDRGEASLMITPTSSGNKITTVETRYLETEFPLFNIVKAETTSVRISDSEGVAARVNLTMLGNDEHNQFGKVLWTANVEGSETHMTSIDFVGVTQYGCCGSSDITRLLNVKSGVEVEAAEGDLFQLEVPNSRGLPMRYVSLAIDSRAPRTFKGKVYLGTISYFSGEKIIARARIYSDLNLHPGWGASIDNLKVVDLTGQPIKDNEADSHIITLWPSNGQTNAGRAYSGFAVSATTSYDSKDESMKIVFKGDTIDETATTVSSGLAVDIVK
jgi:hypothetical protein